MRPFARLHSDGPARLGVAGCEDQQAEGLHPVRDRAQIQPPRQLKRPPMHNCEDQRGGLAKPPRTAA